MALSSNRNERVITMATSKAEKRDKLRAASSDCSTARSKKERAACAPDQTAAHARDTPDRAASRARSLANLRPFKKGEVGNPGGRPKDAHKLAALARSYAPQAMDTIIKIMNDEDEHGKVRLTAASILLDRGFGKSLSQKDVSVTVQGSNGFLDALREISARPKLRVVDGEVTEVMPPTPGEPDDG